MNNVQKVAPEQAETQTEAPAAKAEAVDVQGTVELMSTQADVAGAAADVIGGVESVESAEGMDEGGEGFKEGEKQGKAKQGSGTKAVQDAEDDAHTAAHPLPPPPVMKKELTKVIRKEIRKQERDVLFAYVGLKKVAPNKLAEMVSRLRSLKDLFASILDATTDVVKGLYFKWVRKETVQ